jgi:broad specificity phosphatase PhoE
MNKLRLVSLLGFLFAMGPVAAADATIILVRHAERTSNQGDLPLSEAGRERAALLARMLGHSGITHVFTSEMIRTRETAGPLASRLSLVPVVVPVEQRDALVAQLRRLPRGAVALVVNHGGPIPDIIRQLGAPQPSAIGEEQFDRMFIVTRIAAGPSSVIEVRYGEAPGAAAPGR